MNIHNRQSDKQVFFSLEFVNILLQMEAKAVKIISGHSKLENGLFDYSQEYPWASSSKSSVIPNLKVESGAGGGGDAKG